MSTFIFRGFRSMSEFVPRNPDGTPKRRGDCGPLAVLLCLNVIDPTRWPLTPGALDALVNDMQVKGCLMRADGESNIPGLDRYLSLLRVPHVTAGYDTFRIDLLHAELKALATPDPRLVLVEWSAAGKGLHDDESAVQYHYSAFGGYASIDGHPEKSGYYRGDGDSSTDDRGGKATSPILTGWENEIVPAKPVGYIVIDVPAALKPHPAPVSVPPAPAPHPAPTPHPTPVPARPAAAPAASTSGINLFALFQAAAAYLPLTPAQRALLKLVEGLLCTALVAALPIVAPILSGQSVNWADAGRAALAAAGTAILMAVLKYVKAHADPAL